MIINKSCTGTGKTTVNQKHIKQYMNENKNMKFLSITDRITLSDQHTKSFLDVDINIKHYKHNEFDKEEDEALTICLNSFIKISNIINR